MRQKMVSAHAKSSFHFCQASPEEEAKHRGFDLDKMGRKQRFTGDQDNFPASRDQIEQWAYRFAQQALGPVALNRPSQGITGAHTNPHTFIRRCRSNQHNKRVRVGFSFISHPLEIGGSSQAKTAFHPCLALKLAARQSRVSGDEPTSESA